MITQAQAVILTRRYQRSLRVVATNAGNAVTRAWDGLDGWDEPNIDEFTGRATPIVSGAQRQGAALTAGYLGLMLATKMPSVDATKFLGSVDFRSPFLAYWAALGRGEDWPQAITTGRTRAEDLALDGTTTAARGTATEIDPIEDRITGWERVPGGVCCEFCATVATQRYHTAESASFGHDRCNCDVIPIIGNLRPGRVINRPLLDQLKKNSDDDSTGYVDASGAPAPRPTTAPVEAP